MKISKPTLLIDESKARLNIQRMQARAQRSGASLRPHFKTHQSVTIGEWFREAGVHQITVSSVDMARYFADAGWQDITIAFPYNPLEFEEVERLADQVELNVLIASKAALNHLNQHVNAPLGYFIKVDIGTHRTGIEPFEEEEIRLVGQSENLNHQLKGMLAHAGHTYQPLSEAEAQKIYNESLACFEQVSQIIDRTDLMWSYGDTPSCSILNDFTEVDELRPGNFVFYDTMQNYFGACSLEDIAVCLACPVVSIHPQRNEVVVYGGAVHLSKDFIEPSGIRNFGTVVAINDTQWSTEPSATVNRLSQEHGIIRVSDPLIKQLKVGDILGILPVHSCLTADLQGYYVSLAGKRIDKFNKTSV